METDQQLLAEVRHWMNESQNMAHAMGMYGSGPSDLDSDDAIILTHAAQKLGLRETMKVRAFLRAFTVAKETAYFTRPDQLSTGSVIEMDEQIARWMQPEAPYGATPLNDFMAWAALMVGRDGTPMARYARYQEMRPHMMGTGRVGFCWLMIDLFWTNGVWSTELPREYAAMDVPVEA